MNLFQIGEMGLIEKLKKKVKLYNKEVVVGIGDDTAVIKKNNDTYYLMTTDSMLEKVHFFQDTNPFLLGKKAVNINISDIASMGGIPKYILLSLGMPKNTSLKWIKKFQKGIFDVCEQHQIDLIGGDLFNSSKITIVLMMVGEVKKKYLCLRTKTSPEDLILTTGTLGDSKFGLEILQKKQQIKETKAKNFFINKHLNPIARLKEAKILSQSKCLTTLTDLSDGLSKGLKIMANSNKVDLKINLDKIPISSYLKKYSKDNANYFALIGGEDYELLFTIKSSSYENFKKYCQKTKITSTVIGEVIKGKGNIYIIDKNKKKTA
ncbi:MAG: thiamine-phosphate kinase [bacterium]